jgi:hypothetical protein
MTTAIAKEKALPLFVMSQAQRRIHAFGFNSQQPGFPLTRE